MNARYGTTILLALGAGLLAGCASPPPRVPAPLGTDAAAITIRVHLRLPLQAWLDSQDVAATTVYFVKTCRPPGPPCDEKLIPSNHESEGRVYLLNAEPGEYRPVAAAYQTAVYYGVGTAHVVNIAYLPDALVREAGVQVQAGRLADAGHHRVQAVAEVCAGTADPGQLRYAELMEPGVRKCGVVGPLVDKMRHPLRGLTSPFVIGNKAYQPATGANHFRGFSHETLPGVSRTQILEEARKALGDAGWHLDGEP